MYYILSETKTSTFDRWIWIYGIGVMVSIPLVIGIFTIFRAMDSGLTTDLGGALAAYAFRNIAAGLATAFALYRRSENMMLVMFVTRLLTDVPDFLGIVASGMAEGLLIIPILLVMIVIFWAPSAYSIRTLWSVTD